MFTGSKVLKDRIRELEIQNASLEKKSTELFEENLRFKEQLDKLSTEVNKYIETGIECDECYTILQSNFSFCPKCGKKVTRNYCGTPVAKSDIFKIEPDGDDGCIITGYIGFDDEEIVIPSKINGRNVLGIWNDAFKGCTTFKKVYFEEGCKYIGACAFMWCYSLREIKLPKSLLQIGRSAFYGLKFITAMIIPPNVNFIGSSAFSGCTNLRKIVLPDKLEYISTDMLRSTGIEEIVIPENVVVIDKEAFENTNLKEILIPPNVQEIREGAFRNCQLIEKMTILKNTECSNILGLDWKRKYFHKFTLYCEAGSSALEMGRRLGLKCIEVFSKESSNSPEKIGYTTIWITNLRRGIEMVREFAEVCKAETYSWTERYTPRDKTYQVDLHGYFSYEKAMVIKQLYESMGAYVTLIK